jgi:glucosylceramidase
MKDDPKVYQAYALYLAKFAEAYQAQGVNLFAVAVQNEPEIDRPYPSCLWTTDQFKTFIKDYMGPVFAQRGVKASIMLGTIQDGNFGQYPALLKDPDVSKYVSIVGFQWDGLNSVVKTRSMFPGKLVFQTETECGNWNWKPGYDPNRPQNDWYYGSYTWDKIKAYFDAGVSAYELWNMVLDEEGKSIDAKTPWPQDAAITVDKNTKAVTYTPMFYAFKHFSYYVQSGARYVFIGKSDDALAFLNPDGSVVIELQNKDASPRAVTVLVDGSTLTVTLPGNSFNTLVVPKR